MTDTLQWRNATTLRLTDKLIPNPDSTSELLDQLNNVLVAIDGSFLHIDPRRTNGQVPVDKKAEHPVYVVPAGKVELIGYQVLPKSSRMIVG